MSLTLVYITTLVQLRGTNIYYLMATTKQALVGTSYQHMLYAWPLAIDNWLLAKTEKGDLYGQALLEDHFT